MNGGPDVVFLQEASFKDPEWPSFQRRVDRDGFHSFFSGANTKVDGQDKHAGTAILVKKNLVVRPAWKLCHVGGSAQAVWLGGKLLISLYLAPTFESQEVFALTVAKLFSLPQGTQWVMGGTSMPHRRNVPLDMCLALRPLKFLPRASPRGGMERDVLIIF